MTIEILTESRCFGGWWMGVRHDSSVCHAKMGFSVYLPPKATSTSVPALYWLSGYADRHVELQVQLVASRLLAKMGVALVIPDVIPNVIPDMRPDAEIYTTPQGDTQPDWGVAWYVNATQDPFRHHHRLFDYVAEELVGVVSQNFAIDTNVRSIGGHGSGGLGALCIGLRKQETFRAVSAMAPMMSLASCPGLAAAPLALLGQDEKAWAPYDPVQCARKHPSKSTFLIDFGTEGESYDKAQVEKMMRGLRSAGQAADIRTHRGYGNGVHLVASFMDQHIKHHAVALGVRESKIYETLGLL